MNKIFTCLLLGMILLISCQEDDPITPQPMASLYNLDNSVFLISEGQFQAGNASLEIYNRESQSIDLSVFESVNDRPLGDIFQSMTIHENIAYAVINNSGNIERIDLEDMTALEPITGLTSPRYTIVHNELLWVTDLFSGILKGIDINSLETIHELPVNGWVENIIEMNDKLYMNAVDAGLIYELTTGAQPELESMSVEGLPVHLKSDGEKLIVGAACCDWYWSEPGFIHYVDFEAGNVEWTYNFDEGYPAELELNKDKNRLYWIEDGVKSLDLLFHTSPTIIVNEPNAFYYGFGLDPRNGDIYLSDAGDFTSASSITRYNAIGEFIDSFDSGVVTGDFYFPE